MDTSVAVKWFVNEAGHEPAISLLAADVELAAPDFVLAEIANVLWREERLGEISHEQVNEAVGKTMQFFQFLIPAHDLALGALDLARALQHSVYDCLFLECAVQRRDARLVTADERFCEKVRNAGFDANIVSLNRLQEVG